VQPSEYMECLSVIPLTESKEGRRDAKKD
jgi:hypothetical protein